MVANIVHRQELEVEVEFYSFALQEADDNLVPLPFPEGSESGNFLSFRERRIDIESGGHTHTASLTAEVWDSEPRKDASGGWEAEGEGEIESLTGELTICQMMGNSGTYIQLGRPHTIWKARVQCSGREAVHQLAQVDVPVGVEQYLVQLWPAGD
ncbi:hypothetical protein NCG97_00055 [Streptomyces lydicamycinicus]|uniref:hypothetical protein n=1 Tax=Streptomyces lydicamycinicus TaxID=1546107 RepID=UPI0020352562|nr:hypothetical protein [Streptomyces lydicamycinicus]URZ99422.1 hypothetical protein NCG97_00055 [Streptomyces lydicamycinicus]